MNRKEYLDSINRMDEIIKIQFKIKTQLQEALLKDMYDNLSTWRNKYNDNSTACIVGMNFERKELVVTTTNFTNITFTYSEFLDYYTPINM